MKKQKLILITIIMAFATLGFSFTDSMVANSTSTQDNNIVKIHLKVAATTPGLYEAICDQVSPVFLLKLPHSLYTFDVKFHETHYVVFGTYDEWVWFFSAERNISGH